MADTTLPPLSPALLRTPMVDARSALVSREWARWFQASYDRQGGANAPSNAELNSSLTGTQGDLSQTQESLSQTQDELGSTQGDLTGTQDDLQAVTARVEALEADVAALEATTADQETRLQALEAWRTALVAALPAVLTMANIPALANNPATAALLEDDLTANWRPPINANDTALQDAINAVRDALAL